MLSAIVSVSMRRAPHWAVASALPWHSHYFFQRSDPMSPGSAKLILTTSYWLHVLSNVALIVWALWSLPLQSLSRSPNPLRTVFVMLLPGRYWRRHAVEGEVAAWGRFRIQILVALVGPLAIATLLRTVNLYVVDGLIRSLTVGGDS